MQGQMSEGDPADTRECHQEAAADAKKPTELGSSPTAAAEAKKPTKLGGSPTTAAPPVAQKPQTGGNGGWGAAVAPKLQTGGNGGWGAAVAPKLQTCDNEGWLPGTVAHSKRAADKHQKACEAELINARWMAYADESNRQIPAKRARRVFIDRIDDAENRKVEAEMNYHEAGGAWKEADKRRDAAVADQHRAHLDRQAASADQHSANIDRQRSVEELRI